MSADGDSETGEWTMTATEFRAKCLRLIDEVAETGREIVITKRGRPVARLRPIGCSGRAQSWTLKGPVSLLLKEGRWQLVVGARGQSHRHSNPLPYPDPTHGGHPGRLPQVHGVQVVGQKPDCPAAVGGRGPKGYGLAAQRFRQPQLSSRERHSVARLDPADLVVWPSATGGSCNGEGRELT